MAHPPLLTSGWQYGDRNPIGYWRIIPYATAVSEGGSCPQVDSAFRFRDNSVKIIQAPVLILIKNNSPPQMGKGIV